MPRRRRRAVVSFVSVAVLTVALGSLTVPALRAQTTAAPRGSRVEFEAVSVKPNKTGPGRSGIVTLPGGRVTATNVTLRALIQFAYRLEDFQVVGGPSWLNADRFDIVATGDGNDDGNQFAADQGNRPSRMQLMMQGLLADQFKLRVRHETREMAIYTLVFAHSDARLGPELHASTINCTGPTPGAAHCGIRMGIGTLTIGGATLPQLASSLSGIMDRPVVDRTGSTARFDGTLKWTPDQSTPALGSKAGGVTTVDPNGPSVFTAVQEQFELKLDAGKGPVAVLVVLSAQQPS